MEITVSYFASVREARGASSDHVTLPDGASVGQLLESLRGGALSAIEETLFTRLLVAVNQTVVTQDSVISAEDEVALFPPMTGG